MNLYQWGYEQAADFLGSSMHCSICRRNTQSYLFDCLKNGFKGGYIQLWICDDCEKRFKH
jgi:hypothetical protein